MCAALGAAPETRLAMAAIRVLVVDDSSSLRQLVALTLRRIGFEVVEARDGEQALALARAQAFRLVLTDQYMPRMDGLTLVRALRALPAYRTTPILVVTYESSAGMKRLGRAAGASGWMVKPFEPDQLVEVVRQMIAGAARTAIIAPASDPVDGTS